MPHAVEDWLNYHLFLLGVQHFTIFDTDGSYAPFLQPFVQRGLVTYHGRFPREIAPKLGLAAEQRQMLLEPHALELCLWEHRQVSDWVVALHSFEEYLHSELGENISPLADWLDRWALEVPRLAVFELFQEPMGGQGKRLRALWAHGRQSAALA